MNKIDMLIEAIKKQKREFVGFMGLSQYIFLSYEVDALLEVLEFCRDLIAIGVADRSDAEEFLARKNISNHPHIQDSVTGKEDYEVADLMAEFANKYYDLESGKK